MPLPIIIFLLILFSVIATILFINYFESPNWWSTLIAVFCSIISISLFLWLCITVVLIQKEYVDEYTVSVRESLVNYRTEQFVLLKDGNIYNLTSRYNGRNVFKIGQEIKVKIPKNIYYGINYMGYFEPEISEIN